MVRLKRSEKLEKFLTENRIRMVEKGAGVVHIELKAGETAPTDGVATVLSLLLESNEGLINTATGITPVPSSNGAQFKAVCTFVSLQDILSMLATNK
jgi:hypothetical protein